MPEGTPWRRWSSLLLLTAILVPITLFQPYHNGPPIRSDGEAYHLWTRVLLEGDLSFERYKKVPGINPPSNPAHGKYTNRYPPGLALLRFPVMAWLVQRGPDAPRFSPAEHWANLVLAALALVGVCFLSLRTSELLGIDLAARQRALLALVFGTGLFHYATYDGCFSHIYSALGVALLLWLGVRAVVLGQARPQPLATAVTCFFLVLIRNTNILLVGGLALAYVVGRQRQGRGSIARDLRGLAALVGGTAAACTLQLVINWYYNGRPILSSYGTEPFLWDRPMLWSVLFSYERGLFSYYPVFAVVLAVAWLVPRTRLAAVGFSLLALAYATLYGFWWSWMLGGGFGHRGFVELMPLATVLFAAALGELSPRWRTVVCQAALVATVITLQFMIAYWRGGLPCMGATSALYWRYASRGAFVGILVASAITIAPRCWRWRLKVDPAVLSPSNLRSQKRSVRDAA